MVGLAALTGYAALRIWQQGNADERRPVDAIVVLGAAQYDGVPSPVLRARLDHAIALYRAGLAPVLVVTGGKASTDRSTEAEAARAYAMRNGVPATAILAEDRGTNTIESLDGVVTILRARGLRSAVFVSDRLHMLRVLRIALDRDLDAWGSPTTSSPTEQAASRWVDAMLHELGGLALYYVSGGAPSHESVRSVE